MKTTESSYKKMLQRFKESGKRIDTADASAVEIAYSPAGLPVPIIQASGRKIQLHSKFDPVKEAERFCAEINDFSFDIFVVAGFGFGYHVERIFERKSADTVVVVVEKDPSIIRAALEQRDLSALISDEKLILLVDPDEEELSSMLRGKASQRVSFITHRGSAQLYGEYYTNIINIVKTYFSNKEVNIATLAKFEKLWASNSSRNLMNIISLPAVKPFYGKFENIPALVVCAGPSLNKSLDYIRSNRGKAVIIAVDTAYSILMKNGIVPHFSICVDPQIINARYFEKNYESSTVLVIDPTAHPSVFRFYTGRKAVCGTTFENMKWLEQITGDKGEIAHGGSVSTNAYDFAKRLGASPVVLVGQDLSFTNGLAHARGAYLDEQMHNRTSRFFAQHDSNRRQLFALPKVMIKGIKSPSVHTNQKMMIFLNWFEKRNDDTLVNATYDGAFISNIRHEEMTFGAEYPVDAMIDSLYAEARSELSSELNEMLERARHKSEIIENELTSYAERVEKGCRISDDLYSAMRIHDDAKVRGLLKKLDDVDAYLESRKNVTEIIGISMQRAIHTIMEGYELEGDADIPDNLKVVKRSQFLYTEMHKNIAFNIKLIGKIRRALGSTS